LSIILAFFFLPLTLPNGMRVIDLPASTDKVELLVGYDEPGLADIASTGAARTLLFNTYAAGGEMEIINQQDRTALRLTIPQWALPMLAEQQLASFFMDAPKTTEPAATDSDFRSRVEDEIRTALLANQTEPEAYATEDAFVAI